MIVYKDMTFCPYYRHCRNGAACPRALKPAVKEEANKWWKEVTKGKEEYAPIAIHAAIPNCFEAVD